MVNLYIYSIVNVECVPRAQLGRKKYEDRIGTVGTQKWWNTEIKVRT
jgi:hypothetical protein